MTGPAEMVCKFLENLQQPVYPECKLCERCRHFQEHLPADLHYRTLTTQYLREGVPVEQVRETLWHEWCFPGGVFRLNYVDGEVQICRVSEPGAPASLPGPSAVPSLQAPGAPAGMPAAQPPAAQPPPPPPPFLPAGMPAAVPPVLAVSSPPSTVGPPPKSSGPPPSPPPPPASVSRLCCLLWREQCAQAAQTVEQRLESFGVPLAQRVCSICNDHAMAQDGGVAEHLLSAEHIRRVEALVASREREGQVPAQAFEVAGGGRILLNHFPLKCTVDGDVPAAAVPATAEL